MARFAESSESELSTILEETDAENTKKATKVTLNIFRGYLQEKGLTSKVKLANACMSNLNCYYILANTCGVRLLLTSFWHSIGNKQ